MCGILRKAQTVPRAESYVDTIQPVWVVGCGACAVTYMVDLTNHGTKPRRTGGCNSRHSKER